MDFKSSQTKDNLMRAFAGESQAYNRYLFAASQAKSEKLQVIQKVFEYTAEQEHAHAKVFYTHLKTLSGSSVTVDGSYPVDLHPSTLELLQAAVTNEYHEYEHEYTSFAKVARDEGFLAAAYSFESIALIEKIHGDRFNTFATFLSEGKLFQSDVEEEWLCLNCGHVHKGTSTATACPVCHHPQGFFVRASLSPYL